MAGKRTKRRERGKDKSCMFSHMSSLESYTYRYKYIIKCIKVSLKNTYGGAREITKSLNFLFHKYKNLSLIPRTHIQVLGMELPGIPAL